MIFHLNLHFPMGFMMTWWSQCLGYRGTTGIDLRLSHEASQLRFRQLALLGFLPCTLETPKKKWLEKSTHTALAVKACLLGGNSNTKCSMTFVNIAVAISALAGGGGAQKRFRTETRPQKRFRTETRIRWCFRHFSRIFGCLSARGY